MAQDTPQEMMPKQTVRVGEAGYKSAADVGAKPAGTVPAETSTPLFGGTMGAPIDAEALVTPDFVGEGAAVGGTTDNVEPAIMPGEGEPA